MLIRVGIRGFVDVFLEMIRDVPCSSYTLIPLFNRLFLARATTPRHNPSTCTHMLMARGMVMGKLHPNKLPRHKCKLVLHRWKHSSIYILGYKKEELDTNDSGEEERPPNNEQNQGRAILTAKYIPNPALIARKLKNMWVHHTLGWHHLLRRPLHYQNSNVAMEKMEKIRRNLIIMTAVRRNSHQTMSKIKGVQY